MQRTRSGRLSSYHSAPVTRGGREKSAFFEQWATFSVVSLKFRSHAQFAVGARGRRRCTGDRKLTRSHLPLPLTRLSVPLIPNTQTQRHSGNKSASARREPKEVYGEDAGGLEQMIDAHQYRGKQIQLEATVKVRVIGTGNQGSSLAPREWEERRFLLFRRGSRSSDCGQRLALLPKALSRRRKRRDHRIRAGSGRRRRSLPGRCFASCCPAVCAEVTHMDLSPSRTLARWWSRTRPSGH
jgi:hypothetical protein